MIAALTAPLVLTACAIPLLVIAACIGGTRARRADGIDYEADAMRKEVAGRG